MHCHAAGIGAGGSGCFISPELEKSFKSRIYIKAFFVSWKELDKHGDGLVIKRLSENLESSRLVNGAIVLALDGVVESSGGLDKSRTQIYVPNKFVAQETAKYPNLYFGASINPYRHDAVKRLMECKRMGALLVKWIPSIQLINPSDSSIIPFYQKMRALGLPLLTHAGNERSFKHARNSLGDPSLLALPLSLGVTVIAAHVATTGKVDGIPNHRRLITMFDRYPNLYADISSLTQINKKSFLYDILEHKEIFPRLIYGTDMPLINTLLVSPWYHPLKLSPKTIWRLTRIDNVWDRDVELKKALGVPEEIFTNGRKLFPLILKASQVRMGHVYQDEPARTLHRTF